uniref:Uncharacterized protein n=1 Tax=Candidatus Kentrum sp. SD TaxID=2126332 RepID=A0A451BHZ5_9GAMM|nr:MAG: hypothetical protein BECKSD772E_GA0070983_100916 [Candidatus Kentron sp. SD]VFK41273.1 MAG: hypothetical protein BECKSD772F_GA0070984_10893 [Candidatus Kentron sp. SD]VFK77925.1 MAG: hypothetical protein BECKSD772D_GA0070982_100384 [Candidatus Kentron sp. SD]
MAYSGVGKTKWEVPTRASKFTLFRSWRGTMGCFFEHRRFRCVFPFIGEGGRILLAPSLCPVRNTFVYRHFIEDAIDVLMALFGAESLCQFHRFIDSDPPGYVGTEYQFIGAYP